VSLSTLPDEFPEPAREHLAALVAGKPVAHTIVDTMSAEVIQAIASRPEVTWSVLARQPDRDAAIRLLEYRLQDALLREAFGAVLDELHSPELSRDATFDPTLQELVLRAITGVAWNDPRSAFALFQRYRTRSPELVEIHTACEQVMFVAPLWFELAKELAMPGPLARFLRMQWVASQEVLDQLIADIRGDMTARSSAYLEALDAMAERYTTLLMYIEQIAERFVPHRPHSLGELGEEERRRLSTALGEIDAPMRRGVRFSHMLLAVLVAGALLSLGGFGSAALAVVLVLGAAAAAYSVWTERGMYGRLVRPPLAAYLAEFGTPTDCVVSWLLTNRKAVKKIKAFDVAIDADPALAAIARLGRMGRARGEPITS
jgi:hypothetical protein